MTASPVSPSGGFLEGVDLAAAAAILGTPAICYSVDRVRANARFLKRMAPPPYRHFFSLKSCYLPPVITAVLGQGFGIEVCSPHELALARALAAPAGAIRLHALCLDAQEAEEAVAAQLDLVTIGSLAAARRLCDAAVARGVTTPTAVRVAPATDASNPYLAAGGRLGFSPGDAVLIEVCSLLASCPAIKLVGLHAHTQIEAGDLVGHAEVAEALVALARSLDRELGIKITDLSLGGGLARASAYRAQRSDFDALAGEVVRALGGGVTLALEPGRYLVDDAAVGLTCVLGLHHVGERVWCFVDMTSNALVPFEGRTFPAAPLFPRPGVTTMIGIGDTLSTFTGVLDPEAVMPLPHEGDILVLRNAGGYCVSTMQRFMRGKPKIACFEGGSLCWQQRAESPDAWAQSWIVPDKSADA